MTVKLLNAVDSLNYATSHLHRYLDEHAARSEGPNIGLRGEHLTITFLSLDRVDLSRRLLDSIERQMPDFAGEVLIFDNGSSKRTLATLREFMSRSSLRIRLVQSEENLGVARGRNRAVAEVNSSWVMSLDNDVFFIKDPRLTIQMELAQIGCKFFSFPLLNADQTYLACGNHLYVALDENKSITVSSGSAFDGREMVAPADPTIGTCLFGTCLFEAAAFRSVGGYDEALFIGFEDVDLSIRLFRLGFKVGCSSFPFLVHDHPTGAADLDYSRIRFSREHIMASARHLEAKYGYSFWNTDLLNWLNSKENAIDGSVTDAGSTDSA